MRAGQNVDAAGPRRAEGADFAPRGHGIGIAVRTCDAVRIELDDYVGVGGDDVFQRQYA